jgi:hypothetical protein
MLVRRRSIAAVAVALIVTLLHCPALTEITSAERLPRLRLHPPPAPPPLAGEPELSLSFNL